MIGSCKTELHRKLHLSLDQDAEKVRQLCSRIAQRLNVPQGYASPPRSLRPRWTAFLSILHVDLVYHETIIDVPR